ncbi:MAG: hypothetical protein WD038_12920 [Balneolales bacterium]
MLTKPGGQTAIAIPYYSCTHRNCYPKPVIAHLGVRPQNSADIGPRFLWLAQCLQDKGN